MAAYSTLTDQELFALLARGDKQAFTELYNQHWKFLYNAVYNILRHHQDTLDVCQGLFIWVWENHQHLVIKTNFRSYLYVAAKYKIANIIRSGRVRESLFDGTDFEQISAGAFNEFEVKELKNLIQQLVNSLPPKCREIFVMSREESLTHKQIAERLDISEKTVDEQISRALKKLRPMLGKLTSFVFMV